MISKGLLGLWPIGSSLSTGFQVYLFKCWDPCMSPGRMIRLAFFLVFLISFCMLIFSLPVLGWGSQPISLSPGFCVCKPRQKEMICWSLDLLSFLDCLVFPGWLFLADGINKCGLCRARGRGC